MGRAKELPSPVEMKEAMTRVSAIVDRAAHELSSLAQEYGVHGSSFACMDGFLRVTRHDGKWGVYVIKPGEATALDGGLHADQAGLPRQISQHARAVSEGHRRSVRKDQGSGREEPVGERHGRSD